VIPRDQFGVVNQEAGSDIVRHVTGCIENHVNDKFVGTMGVVKLDI